MGKDIFMAGNAPAPVGAYPHARREGNLLFLSGVGPRQPGTNEIPGGPIRDADGNPRLYDAGAQTRATIENVKTILEACGSSLENVVDVTSFLINMDRDFQAYNEVYAEYFTGIHATRTTLQIGALPTPIAVELKVIARSPKRKKEKGRKEKRNKKDKKNWKKEQGQKRHNKGQEKGK